MCTDFDSRIFPTKSSNSEFSKITVTSSMGTTDSDIPLLCTAIHGCMCSVEVAIA